MPRLRRCTQQLAQPQPHQGQWRGAVANWETVSNGFLKNCEFVPPVEHCVAGPAVQNEPQRLGIVDARAEENVTALRKLKGNNHREQMNRNETNSRRIVNESMAGVQAKSRM